MTVRLDSDFSKWYEDAARFYSQGFSAIEIRNLRNNALIAYAAGIVGDFEEFYDSLLSHGVVVGQELEFLAEHTLKSFEGGSLPLSFSQAPTSTGKIITWEKAIKQMKDDRSNGKRVAISFGNFDVGTEGHKAILNDFAFTTSAWGELFILVGEDQLVSIRKGSNRPYVPHQQRMEFVASQPGVNWVVPVIFPGNPTIDELPEFYLRLQLEMKGLAHFRLIGDKESTYESYLAQCNEADILLIYSDMPRISSATIEGTKKYSHSPSQILS